LVVDVGSYPEVVPLDLGEVGPFLLAVPAPVWRGQDENPRQPVDRLVRSTYDPVLARTAQGAGVAKYLCRVLGVCALLASSLVFPSPPPALAQTLVRAGSEFQVNVYTDSNDTTPAVSRRGVGFVVVWSRSDGGSNGVFGRRFTSTGQPQGGDFQVNVTTLGQQYRPAVAADVQGNFVVVWESVGQDGNDRGVFGRRFDFAGGSIGGEFQVNSFTPAIRACRVWPWMETATSSWSGPVISRTLSSAGCSDAVSPLRA
jgi:hypothetical protein